MPISGSAMCPTVTPAPRAASSIQRCMPAGTRRSAGPAVRPGGRPGSTYPDRPNGRSRAAAAARSSSAWAAPAWLLLLHSPPLRMCGAVVAVLEIVVRHVEAVADATLDRLHRRAVTVLAQVMVAFAGPHQRLDNFAFHQPAAPGHGREPERGLVEAFVALASRRRGELGLNPIECRHRIGAAAIVAGLAVVRLAGFLALRRAQDLLDPVRQWRCFMDRRRVLPPLSSRGRRAGARQARPRNRRRHARRSLAAVSRGRYPAPRRSAA